MKRTYRGRWTQSSLSAVTIAKLMGCHTVTARRILAALVKENDEVTEDILGELICSYRNQREYERLRRYG